MRHEEFLKGANVENITEYMYRYDKTAALIDELAKHGNAWTNENISRATAETNCFEFSSDDVEFIGRWQNDAKAQKIEENISKLLKCMEDMDIEHRRKYYKEQVEPLLDARNKHKQKLKMGLDRMVFYGCTT